MGASLSSVRWSIHNIKNMTDPHPRRNSSIGRTTVVDALSESGVLALHEALTAGELWRALERLLRGYLPADTYNFFLHVPEFDRPQVVFSSSKAIKNLTPEDLRRALNLSGTIPYLTANPGVALLPVNAVYPDRKDFLRSAYYREYLHRNNWCDVLGMPLWEGERLIGFLALVHSTGEGEFSELELEKARRLCPHVQTAARRVMRAYREKSVRLALQKVLRDLNRPVLLLSWEGNFLFATRTARDYLSRWSNGVHDGYMLARERTPALPEPIQTSVRHLRTRYMKGLRAARHKGGYPHEVVTHPRDDGLYSELRLVGSGNSALVMPSVLIEFKEADASRLRKDPLASSLDELSPREREVVRLLCRGWSNAEIAREVGRTVGSVKQQISVIYDKLNVRGRTRLMAMYSGLYLPQSQ